MTKPMLRWPKLSDELRLLMRLVTDQGREHLGQYGIAIFFMVLVAATTSISAYLMRDVVNKVFVENSWAAVIGVSVTIIAVFTIKGFATYGQQVTLSRIANAVIASIQRRLYDHMLAMDVSYFIERHSAEFIGRMSMISQSAAAALNTLVTSLGRDALSLVGLSTVMIVQDPTMALLGVVVVPPAIFGVQKLVRRAKSVMMTEFKQGIVVMEVTQETAQNIRVIKAYTLEDTLRRRMWSALAAMQAASDKLARVGARSSPLMETLGGFAIASMVFYGGWRINATHTSPGEFFSFITALLLAYEPAKRLARTHVEISSQLVGVSMLYHFLDEPPREHATEGETLPAGPGEIVLDNVTFAYRAGEPVLKAVSLVAEAGKTTALVGPSGSGKSTIFSLLLRFWTHDAGSVRIDGREINGVSLASLRHSISYVSQDAVLFKGTVADNIGLGRPGASHEEIVEAAKAAHAHDFISGFERGYDTEVGEQGVKLSGGQKQRIAIARAVLKDAPILLLDEATAALDAESERAIQDALTRLSVDRTTLVIAHRLQTIQNADKIVFLEAGRVIEEGSHESLREQAGRYATMYKLSGTSA